MLSHHTSSNAKRISAIVAFGALLSFGVPSVSSAAECPNEQLREESLINPATGQPYSMQLPDCRAYELVSPPNTSGMPAILGDGGRSIGSVFEGNGPQFIATASGAVLFESQATPPGTGASADGGYVDTFRSRRTAAGWTTTDVLPSDQRGYKGLLAASGDGSAVLLETPISFSPEDVDNPLNIISTGKDLYIAREGRPQPEFVTQGELPHRVVGESDTAVGNVAVNPSLTAVGFETEQSLAAPLRPGEVTPGCYVWAEAGSRLARLTNPEGSEPVHQRNCRYLAVAANGQPVIEDTSGDGGTGLIFATDPAPNANFPAEGGTRQLSGATPNAARFDAMSPDGGAVYLTTSDKLASLANGDKGNDIYRAEIEGSGLTNSNPPTLPALTCISCQASGHGNAPEAIYVGTSADGSHVYFTGQALSTNTMRPELRNLLPRQTKSTRSCSRRTAST